MLSNEKLSTDSDSADVVAQQCRFFNREQFNLEPHQLVWCSSKINDKFISNKSITLQRLREIVDYTKLFQNDVKDCVKHLELTTDSVTFLVCSDGIAEKLLARVHDFKSVRIIYVYCCNTDEDNYKSWSSSFTKVM